MSICDYKEKVSKACRRNGEAAEPPFVCNHSFKELGRQLNVTKTVYFCKYYCSQSSGRETQTNFLDPITVGAELLT